MDEEWAIIAEFPNYSISTLGRVKNEDRGRIVQTSRTIQGAVKVGMVSGGRQYTRSVKILVAEAFVPGATEQFDTPLLLDGDQTNNTVGNIVWRPRWFCWKYQRQLSQIDYYIGIGPLTDRKTGLVYSDIAQAAITNGLLPEEVQMSLVEKVPCFPTWHIFDWVHEEEKV